MRLFIFILTLSLHFTAFAQSDSAMRVVYVRADKNGSQNFRRESEIVHPALKKIFHQFSTDQKTNSSIDASQLEVIRHHGYTSVMHKGYMIPAWVSHRIKSSELLHPGKFQRDDNYPKDSLFPSLKSDAYKSTGYDHGHLAPARDFKHNEEQYTGSNTMTNMTPQHGCFNQKGWCMLESLCREWAITDSNAVVYIISGPVLNSQFSHPLFIDSLCINQEQKIYIPHWYFKAVCIYDRHNKQATSIGFLVPNELVENEEIRQLELSIDELEHITGLDFFSALQDKMEASSEALIPELNFGIQSECGSKPCEKVYGKRVRPEGRKSKKCD